MNVSIILFLCVVSCLDYCYCSISLGKGVHNVPFHTANKNVTIKISKHLLPAAKADQLSSVVWTTGDKYSEVFYCVSDYAKTNLQFQVINQNQTNVTKKVLLHETMLTVIAGFPAISAVFDSIKIELNQAQIICTQTINNSVISSAPVVINLQYLQNVEVKEVDQGNITVIPSKTNVVYVECIKNNNGTCLGRNKMLICEAEANPTPTHSDYTWWQNGQFLNSGKRLIVNSTMSGSAIQCGVSTSFLYSRVMSSVFMIQAYAPAHLLHVAKIDESLTLKCALEGASSLNAVWRMRRPNGLVTTAPCSRSTDQNLPTTSYHRSVIKNSLNRKLATCELHITDDSYTGQYWCCAIDSLSDCLQNPQDKRIAEVEVQRADFDIETTIQSK